VHYTFALFCFKTKEGEKNQDVGDNTNIGEMFKTKNKCQTGLKLDATAGIYFLKVPFRRAQEPRDIEKETCEGIRGTKLFL
jgi:hypothetical protein